MAVGGFILALGIVLIVGGYIAGPPTYTPTGTGNASSGQMRWNGPGLVILGATISPTGAVILVYGVAVRRVLSSPPPKPLGRQ